MTSFDVGRLRDNSERSLKRKGARCERSHLLSAPIINLFLSVSLSLYLTWFFSLFRSMSFLLPDAQLFLLARKRRRRRRRLMSSFSPQPFSCGDEQHTKYKYKIIYLFFFFSFFS
jgi:hypothetical protein